MALHLPPSSRASPPQSVEKITRIAQDYEYNPLIPLRYWLRSATTLIREVCVYVPLPLDSCGLTDSCTQARIYEREGQDEQVYLLLFRHAQLVLVNLVKHPDAKDEKYRTALVDAEKEVRSSLKKLEVLKPRINKRYDRYTQLMRERQSRKGRYGVDTASLAHGQPYDPALSGTAEPLEAGKNQDLAVKLARNEISRRETVRRTVRPASTSVNEEQSRRGAGVWGDWEKALGDGHEVDNDLSKRIREVRVNIEHAGRNRNNNGSTIHPTTQIPSPSAYKYPAVPRQNPLESVPLPSTVHLQTDTSHHLDPPSLPPKELLKDNASFAADEPPPRPNKVSPAPAPALSDKLRPVDGKDAPPGLDPSSFMFKPSAYLENGAPLRTVFLPPELRGHFVALAAENTRRNLETCGILCGTLISNALFISRLLIPEQISTSDTCETVNESAIFDYCDSEDLMMLGWIHTHPTQTCFMSSRDLHTHCGYQVMMPESIAIVCAPSQNPDWGVFRLTDPPGLKTVLNCTQTGLFHPHSEHNIYTDALRPGHVFEAKGLEFETVDLRPSGPRS